MVGVEKGLHYPLGEYWAGVHLDAFLSQAAQYSRGLVVWEQPQDRGGSGCSRQWVQPAVRRPLLVVSSTVYLTSMNWDPHQGLRAGPSHWTKQVKIHILYPDIYI